MVQRKSLFVLTLNKQLVCLVGSMMKFVSNRSFLFEMVDGIELPKLSQGDSEG